MELRSLVSSLGYLVSNGRQVLLGDIRLGGSATPIVIATADITWEEAPEPLSKEATPRGLCLGLRGQGPHDL